MDFPNLSRTAKAIEERDSKLPVLDKRFDESAALADAARCKAIFEEMEALERAVGEAYGEDTKDRNNPQTCTDLVRAGPPIPGVGQEISFVRKMVAKWKAQGMVECFSCMKKVPISDAKEENYSEPCLGGHEVNIGPVWICADCRGEVERKGRE